MKNKFLELKEKWISETYLNSYTSTNNIYYQQIIKLGERVIPFLLEDMKEHGTHWFRVLYTLTGQNPIKKENIGNIKAMISDWLKWGHKNHYFQYIDTEGINPILNIGEDVLSDYLKYSNEQISLLGKDFNAKTTWVEMLEDYSKCPECNSIDWKFNGASGFDSNGSFQDVGWRTCRACGYSDND